MHESVNDADYGLEDNDHVEDDENDEDGEGEDDEDDA